ncbi:hypothetical protein F0U44_04835 [Nocardioides humilatus]|uniref:Uncharacterized protein n=1 Tax=Nocardioides humilatus TaxID=2607660 RepID=A0A5B1LMA1_9ACTN|nr:hypothetical protein [Nocardioides humilatus]KAA1421606.1 hypothetical protein F0U44_04835 [Nocardioides humilatus]
MSDDQEKSDNPVLTGLVALIAVSLAVGLVLGGVALVGARVLGIGEGSSASVGATERESAIIPKPSRTAGSGPQVTLATDEPTTEDTGAGDPQSEATTEETEEEKAITLQAGQTAVGNFQRIDLSGVYPGGEGAILQVQRFESGAWADFDATIPVSNETFSTYVQSALVGVNKFRVIDNASGDASNPVTVTVG